MHRYANALGQFLGPLSAGLIAYAVGWRWPFIIFSFVTAFFVILAFRLREPMRGRFERRAMGVSEDVVNTEEEPPPVEHRQVRTLRRIYYALPFLAVAVVGLLTLGASTTRRCSTSTSGPAWTRIQGGAQLVGLMVGLRIVTRLMARGPGFVVQFPAAWWRWDCSSSPRHPTSAPSPPTPWWRVRSSC